MPAHPLMEAVDANGAWRERTVEPGSPLSERAFRRFSDCIMARLGIKMAPGKQPMLQSRLQRRLRELQLESFDAYQELLFSLPDEHEEWTHFINAVTTNKTDFFREPRHYDYLRQVALPDRERQRVGVTDPLSIWCAGCSTGEEAYSLSMVLAEYGSQRQSFEFRILATDISTRVLEVARRAVYDEARIEPVPLDWRRKYLLRSRDPQQRRVRIVPELRAHVSFGRLNFMEDNYGLNRTCDIIFFRNVMIYFDRTTQESVLRRMCRYLASGGYLFVGHSETLTGLDVPLRPVSTSVYRRE
jgi:chemotaxis protein methyltransferase CheR